MSVKLVYSPTMLALYLTGDDMRMVLETASVDATVEVAGREYPAAIGSFTLNQGATELLKAVQKAWDDPVDEARRSRAAAAAREAYNSKKPRRRS